MFTITGASSRPVRPRTPVLSIALLAAALLAGGCADAGDFMEDQAIREFEENQAASNQGQTTPTTEDLATGNEATESTTGEPAESSDPTAREGEISLSAGEVDCVTLQEELQVLGVQAQLLAQYRADDPEGWKADLDQFELLQLDRFEQSLDAFEVIADSESTFGRVGDSLDVYRQASGHIREAQWDQMTELSANHNYIDLMLKITGGMGEAGC